MIELRNVSFRYEDSLPILEDACLTLEGGLTLLLGPNGCGKSTLMRIVAGVERPQSGSVRIGGNDLWEHETDARRLLAYVPEQPDVTPYASIDEVLALVCRLRGVPVEERNEVAARAGVFDYRRYTIRDLSLGQRRRVLLAAAWIGAPRVLLLDEPLVAMDRAMRFRVEAWTRATLERKATLLVISHELGAFGELASSAVSIRNGKIRRWDRLPSDAAERAALLDEIARGSFTAGMNRGD
jgi:ABC-type multidrug transport system ATPase subunit